MAGRWWDGRVPESIELALAVPDCVVVTDLELRIVAANPMALALHGLATEGEAVGRSLGEFVAPEYLEALAVARDLTSRAGVLPPMRFETIGPGGRAVHLEATAAICRDASGAAAGFLVVGRDLTREVKAEQELRESEDRFRKVFRVSPDLISITAIEDAAILDVNDSVLRTFGYARDELLGRSIYELGLYEDQEAARALRRRLVEEGSLRDAEVRTRTKDGISRTLLLSAERIDFGGRECMLAVMRDITERKEREEDLERRAYQDPLTGLPNRALFLDRLAQSLARARRAQTMVAVLMLDLDRFKEVNDAHGHAAGDEVLRAAAERLGACLRKSDTVARLGGDEYAIVLPDIAGTIGPTRVITRIMKAFERPVPLPAAETRITVSAGVAMFPADGDEPDALLRSADQALYRAKDEGRDTFRFFSSELGNAASKRMSLEHDLRKAIDRNEFVLHYQPQVAVESGRIIGVEALVRWQHPDKGMIPPYQFIPVAEETGMIVPLGALVLQTACRQMAEWRASGLSAPRLAVNMSPRQLRDPGFPGAVEEALRDLGGLPEGLELEITETALMEDVERAVSIIRRLRDTGVRVGLDDFGTGYSSLTQLHRFPIDTLKIGQEFVRDMASRSDAAAIIEVIVGLARRLGIQVVVTEGVETQQQLAMLRGLGCEIVQGYLFSRPVGAEALVKLLKLGRAEPSTKS